MTATATAVAASIRESALDPAAAVLDHTVPAGEPYLLAINRGQTLRIVDLEGNQAVDVIFYNRDEVAEQGQLTFADGVSAPGKYVELRAEMNLWMLVSNCPQLNNPCNAYNPTPARFLLWDPQ